MADDKQQQKPLESVDLDLAMQGDFEQLEQAKKRGLFGRFNRKLDEAIESGRGHARQRDAVIETAGRPDVAADDIAMRRAKSVNFQKMIIPEGVIIEGSISGGSETEISGRVEGNVTVEGQLYLGKSALISGNVRAGSCRIEGLVEGKVECSEVLELGETGRLNADVMAGKRIHVAGQIFGHVTTPGVLRLAPNSKIEGDIKTRSLIMEEGATLNGSCIMRPPSQRTKKEA